MGYLTAGDGCTWRSPKTSTPRGDGQGEEIDWGTVKDYAAHRW